MAENERGPHPLIVARQQMEQREQEFAAALPAHIPLERFKRVVLTALQNNRELLDVSRASLWNSCVKAAQDGLLPDGREGAIVPYKGEAQWMPMIGGIRKKVRNSGEIATWDVQAVHEGDLFDFELGDEPFIQHKPALTNRGKLIAVYSIATLKSGEKSRDVMSVEDVEKIRAKSRSQKGPWSDPTFYPEMAKKTVARRHSKVLPMSTDLDDLMRRDDALYDIDGASDREVKKARPTLSDTLDRLADGGAPRAIEHRPAETVDVETGEIGDDNRAPAGRRDAEPEDKRSRAEATSDRPASAKPAGERAARRDEAPHREDSEHREPTPADRAFDDGYKARRDGRSRKATPKYETEREASAWGEGWDMADAEMEG